MADKTPPLDEARLEDIKALFSDTEQARERLHGLMGSPLRPRAPMVEAVRDLLAEVDRLRASRAAVTDAYNRLEDENVALREHLALVLDDAEVYGWQSSWITKARALLASSAETPDE